MTLKQRKLVSFKHVSTIELKKSGRGGHLHLKIAVKRGGGAGEVLAIYCSEKGGLE